MFRLETFGGRKQSRTERKVRATLARPSFAKSKHALLHSVSSGSHVFVHPKRQLNHAMVQDICCQPSEEKNNVPKHENQYHAAKAAASEHARLRDAMAAESVDEYASDYD